MAEQPPIPEERQEAIRSRYIPLLAPLFFPEDAVERDVVRYFSCLLRIGGMEDAGWDPYEESRGVLDDLNALMQIDLPADKFSNKALTTWRLGLIFYSHIVEMDAPYEVLTNLLRFRLRKGYSPNPFSDFLTTKQKKRARRSGLYPKDKIGIIKRLSDEGQLGIGNIFDEFFRNDLRNAISHSDFIFTDGGFRCRGSNWINAFKLSFEELDDLLTKARVFIGTFFGLEREARRRWGQNAGRGIPYDPRYKGLMEVLVDGEGLMNGFSVHWPNRCDSIYRRTKDGVIMTNCMFDKHGEVMLSVGSYARRPGEFSPLVEVDGVPSYTRVEGSNDDLIWPEI